MIPGKREVKKKRREPQSTDVVARIDATAMQCPGPILRLKEEIEKVAEGQMIAITSSDPGFPGDVKGFCNSTGHQLVNAGIENGVYFAAVAKGAPLVSTGPVRGGEKRQTIVVFSGDFDKAMASFIIANGAAAMGSEVTLFFTFWGLNLLRRPESVSVSKTFIEQMFGFMMPRGAERTKLSKMNMGGMGTQMIKGIMKKKNVSSLSELIAKAKAAGVRLVACTMTMELMGIKREELIDGVEEGGVAMYLDQAQTAGVNLFI